MFTEKKTSWIRYDNILIFKNNNCLNLIIWFFRILYSELLSRNILVFLWSVLHSPPFLFCEKIFDQWCSVKSNNRDSPFLNNIYISSANLTLFKRGAIFKIFWRFMSHYIYLKLNLNIFNFKTFVDQICLTSQ